MLLFFKTKRILSDIIILNIKFWEVIMLGYLKTSKMLTIDYLENNRTTIDNVSLKDRKNIKI